MEFILEQSEGTEESLVITMESIGNTTKSAQIPDAWSSGITGWGGVTGDF